MTDDTHQAVHWAISIDNLGTLSVIGRTSCGLTFGVGYGVVWTHEDDNRNLVTCEACLEADTWNTEIGDMVVHVKSTPAYLGESVYDHVLRAFGPKVTEAWLHSNSFGINELARLAQTGGEIRFTKDHDA